MFSVLRFLLLTLAVGSVLSTDRSFNFNAYRRQWNRIATYKNRINTAKNRIYSQSSDGTRMTRALRSCWLNQSGQCCANDVPGCMYYRRRRAMRSNYYSFYMSYSSFHPGNFYYRGCQVQCWCTQYHASCIAAITTTTTSTTTTTTTTTAAATSTTTVDITSMSTVVTSTTTADTTITTLVTSTTAGSTTTSATSSAATQSSSTATTTTSATPTTTTTATASTSTTTNAAITTVTTTTAAITTTTTAATTRYCPAEASTAPTTRLLGGTALAACTDAPGVVSLELNGATLCTGVITGATTLTIPNNCAPIVNGANVVAQDGTIVAEAITASSTDIGGPIAIILKNPVSSSGCPGIACVYSSTMASAIQLSTCRAVAAGAPSNTAEATPEFGSIPIPSFMPTETCNPLLVDTTQSFLFNLANTAITYNCFINPSASTCQGDFGGPIICDLSSGEQTVIGQIENAECSAGSVVGFYNLETQFIRVATRRNQVILG